MLKRLPLGFVLLLATSAWAQNVISAHSGVIQWVEGTVVKDGQPVHLKVSEVQDVKNDQTLAAEEGRAEVLLTPGVFLRIKENSSFRMVSNKRSDTRIEVLSGTALFEVGELLQDNAVTVLSKGAEIALLKKGLYRIDSDPARLRVFDGEARVSASDGDPLTVRKGREVMLGSALEARNFDTKETDEFYRWSSRRDQYVTQANIASATTARDLGYGGLLGNGMAYTGTGVGMPMGSWAWNPWFGMFTYLPYNGISYSPFGYAFFSPGYVNYFYQQPSYYGYSAGNYSNVNRGSTASPFSSNTASSTSGPARGSMYFSAPSSGSTSGFARSSGASGAAVSSGASMSSGGMSAGHVGGSSSSARGR